MALLWFALAPCGGFRSSGYGAPMRPQSTHLKINSSRIARIVMTRQLLNAVLPALLLAALPVAADAAVVSPAVVAGAATTAGSDVVQVQGRHGGRPIIVAPRPYYAPRIAPRVAPYAYRGPVYAYHRPWVRRPYFGTIIAGIALGTIVGVTAYGLVPPRPRPDLCWYWIDEVQSQGYWDYC